MSDAADDDVGYRFDKSYSNIISMHFVTRYVLGSDIHIMFYKIPYIRLILVIYNMMYIDPFFVRSHIGITVSIEKESYWNMSVLSGSIVMMTCDCWIVSLFSYYFVWLVK